MKRCIQEAAGGHLLFFWNTKFCQLSGILVQLRNVSNFLMLFLCFPTVHVSQEVISGCTSLSLFSITVSCKIGRFRNIQDRNPQFLRSLEQKFSSYHFLTHSSIPCVADNFSLCVMICQDHIYHHLVVLPGKLNSMGLAAFAREDIRYDFLYPS